MLKQDRKGDGALWSLEKGNFKCPQLSRKSIPNETNQDGLENHRVTREGKGQGADISHNPHVR